MILSRDQRSRQRAYDDVIRAPLKGWCPTCEGAGCNEDDSGPCETCHGAKNVVETDAQRDARVDAELEGVEYGPSHHELHGRI